MEMEHIYTELQTPTQDIYSGISPGGETAWKTHRPGKHHGFTCNSSWRFCYHYSQFPLSSAGQAAPRTVASQLQGPMQTFLQGQPKALGVVQIMIGIMSLPFGLVLVDRYTFTGGIALPLWTGVWVKACLGMNVISSVFAGVGIILYSINLSIVPLYINDFNRSPGYYYPHSYSTNKHGGILAVLLVLNILEMCIAIATSAFGYKSESSYTAMPVVAFQQP